MLELRGGCTCEHLQLLCIAGRSVADCIGHSVVAWCEWRPSQLGRSTNVVLFEFVRVCGKTLQMSVSVDFVEFLNHAGMC